MKIEILHIGDCPSWREAGTRVEAALVALRIHGSIEYRLLNTAADAAGTRFVGSPTILLNGDDLFPVMTRSADLACRMYATPDGLRGVPTTEQLVDALRQHG